LYQGKHVGGVERVVKKRPAKKKRGGKGEKNNAKPWGNWV